MKAKKTISLLLIAIIQGIEPVLMMLVWQKIINGLQTRNVEFSQLVFFVLIYVLILVTNALLLEIYGLYQASISKKFEKYVSIIMLEKVASLNLQSFEDSTTYDVINRAQRQNGDSILQYIQMLFNVLQFIVTGTSSIFILMKFNISLVFLIMLIPIIQYLYSLKVARRQYEISFARVARR